MDRKNRKLHTFIISLFFLVYALTFLPHFDVFNSLTFIGPLPEPLAWVLFLNVINTVIMFIIYFKFFKPFAQRIEKKFDDEGVHEE